MRFSVSALIWTPFFGAPHFHLLPAIKEHGFDGFEVAFFEPLKIDAAAIRRAIENCGLEPLACNLLPSGMNPTSDDPAVRGQTRQHFIDCIRVTAELGAKCLGGPIYAPVGYLPGRRRTPDEWQWAVECFQSLGDTLEAHGVTLAIEPLNRFATYFLNTAADAVALSEAIGHPSVGVLLDTFHTNIEEKDVATAFRSTGRHLKHIQACENDRGIPGTGHVAFPAIAAALAGT
ncbi:MAG: sugar phosphate isomerase/epimerase, partial [Candidatus Solibacter sp.]|nr:sugar phosphate isomerase/epimerase [Candidatus Solibacter sp.]